MRRLKRAKAFFCLAITICNLSYAQEQTAETQPVYFDQLYSGRSIGDWNSTLQIFRDARENLEQVNIGTATRGKKDARLSLSIVKAKKCVVTDFPDVLFNPDDFLNAKTIPVAGQPGMFRMQYEQAPVGEVSVVWVVDKQVFSFKQKHSFSQATENFDLEPPKNSDAMPLLKALSEGRQLIVKVQGFNQAATFSLKGFNEIKQYATDLCLAGKLPEEYAQ